MNRVLDFYTQYSSLGVRRIVDACRRSCRSTPLSRIFARSCGVEAVRSSGMLATGP